MRSTPFWRSWRCPFSQRSLMSRGRVRGEMRKDEVAPLWDWAMRWVRVVFGSVWWKT